MKIRILGAGWYGCHLGAALMAQHDVEIHEIGFDIMQGASGSIPARLHQGFHYPRSRMTRAACLEHRAAFMGRYGHLTHGVPINIYAIAADHSLVDYDQYVRTMRGEVDFIEIVNPLEFGLRNIEGAVLTGERHIVTRLAREYFRSLLGARVKLRYPPNLPDEDYDWTVDCTFAAQSAAGIDRYEPCIVLQMEGSTDRAVTIMDGPFGSLYPWDEAAGLCSLSSALWTPFSKTIRNYTEAMCVIAEMGSTEVRAQGEGMIAQMREFYPDIDQYKWVDSMLSVRAMPLSGADSRLVDVRREGDKMIRIRAGKIDAIIHAEAAVREIIGCA